MAPKRIKVRPGKTQSRIGFVVGILFVLLGCVVVIPTFGLFGIIWTALAGMIAYMNFKNGFSDKGVASHEIIIEDGTEGMYERYGTHEMQGYDSSEDIEAKLIKLTSLYEQRLITKEEYDAKRKELLDDF